jgi:hypothetical protein
MGKVLTCILILAAAFIASLLYAICIHLAGIAPENGAAIAVVIAALMAFNRNRKGGPWLTWEPGRFHVPPFAIVTFVFALSSFFAASAYLWP